MRKKQRKVLANFDKRGFFLTGTYEDCYLPDDEDACWKDVENYARRVKYATCKRFGVEKEKIRLMLWAVRKGEAERREWREMLEDLWRRRIPGTREFEPLGTMNVDRMDMKKLLGLSGEGKNGTLGYIYGHSWRRCLETRNLILPEEQRPNDSRWSRKQLHKGCTDCADCAYWWEQWYPGWECVKVMIYDPGQLHESEDARPGGWEATEPQAYLILRRRGFAKART